MVETGPAASEDAGTARPATDGRPERDPELDPAPRPTPGPQERDFARRTAPAAAEADPARRTPTGPAPATAAEDRAGDGAPAASGPAGSSSRTAPRFVRLRAQHTDAMTSPPPPPPASARFPDTPPRPSRPAPAAARRDETSPPGRAEDGPPAPNVPRPGPPHDFRRPPRPTRPAPRPAPTSAPPSTKAPAPTSAPASTDAPASADVSAPRLFGAPPSRPYGPPAPGAPGTGPTAPGGFGGGSARPADVGDTRSAGRADAPVAGPVADHGSERAWSPLPRGWVPAPGPARHETPAEGAGAGPRGDSRPEPAAGEAPAWSPGAAVRQPDFTLAPEPPAPQAPRRPDGTQGTVNGPDPALSWSAPMTPGGVTGSTRPVVRFARPEGYTPRILGRHGRTVAAAACAVLGLGLIGGALTGSWLVGGSGDSAERSAYTAAGGLWHNVPVDQLFPPTVDGQGAGPGGADRTWTRIAVAPDSGCAGVFDPLLLKVLAPAGCRRVLRATYTDATQSYVTTVGLLFTDADAAAMRALDARFAKEGLAQRADLMPRPYAAKGTVAAGFGDRQRAAWTVSVLTDAPVVVYAVSGWADGRTVDTPQPAPRAAATGATTAPAQAGLGNEAQGLADRVERGLRKTAVTPSEQPS
ncbi:hypothetical protein GCM10010269_18130 [Streptomyces humidus]|uniref:Uncharacterized protein n=1 Tax=Streptomyces humidus TaxID=52259 RepID=A0A918L1Z8_9ACTN|nr:hypothetical protein [Streptomyces humidus]GGR79280.1 hypothetical protein GCM10010269_18130 [Streptomyces humidus]